MGHQHRSLFWPIILVGVGVLWLLVNLNVIAQVDFSSVLRLWPLLLVVIGLDLLLGRQNAWSGAIIGVIAIGALAVFLVLGPSLGWTTANMGDARVESFSTPLENTTRANFVFDLSSEHVNIYALNTAGELIAANIAHTGSIDYTVSGSGTRTVHLAQRSNSSGFVFDLSSLNLKWNLGITPEIPVNLTLNGGSGSVTADLTGLKLQSLQAVLGSGYAAFTLPESASSIPVQLKSGSGALSMILPSKTNLTITADSGSGSLTFTLPSNAEARVEVYGNGSSSLNLPPGFQTAAGSFSGSTEAWQTSGYATATAKILIRINNIGSGSITIQ
jgi:hypothetical protein